MCTQSGDLRQNVALYSKVTARSLKAVNAAGGIENCINCAIAVDLMLAGFPASALPGSAARITVLEKFFGAKFGSPIMRAELIDLMLLAGSGARGIVFGYRTSGIGHVFNVINQRSTIRFLDGQTGRGARLDDYLQFQLLRTNG